MAHIEAAGRIQTSVRFDTATGMVTVIRRNRALTGAGERSVHVAQLAGVVWKKAGWVGDGWLAFTMPGMVAPTSGLLAPVNDPWTIPFRRRHQPAMFVVREAIEQAMRDVHQPPGGAPGRRWGR